MAAKAGAFAATVSRILTDCNAQVLWRRMSDQPVKSGPIEAELVVRASTAKG